MNVENSCRGFVGSLLQNERQRRHVARLRPGRNIVQGPIVRSGEGRQPRRWLVRSWLDAERRFQYGHYYRLKEENCDWKSATPSEFSCGWSPQCLMSFYTNQTKVSQAEHLVPASNWTWPKNDSSAMYARYLNTVVMLLLHHCVSTANFAKNIIAYQSQRVLANFMQF